MKKISFWHN